MKAQLISRFLTLAFVCITLQASAFGPTYKTPDIYKQLQAELQGIAHIIKADAQFEVYFMVNEKNQFIVLDTSDERYDDLVSTALDYLEIREPQGLKPGQRYVLPVSVEYN